MAEIVTSVEIEAPPARVWSLLTDFSSYPRWNPLIPEASGEPGPNQDIQISLQLPIGPAVPVPVRITRFEPEKELEWTGSLPFLEFLFQGRHYFRLQKIDENRTRFINGEEFTGLLEAPFRKLIEDTGTPLYRDMNFALKQEAERPV